MPEIHGVAITIGDHHQLSLPLMIDEEGTQLLCMRIDTTQSTYRYRVEFR